MKQIQLTRGFVALIDDEDFERVSRHKWSCMNHGMAQARIGDKRVLMHRFILDLNGDGRSVLVDHVNHNQLDNRRCNLRICTPRENNANRVPNAGKRYKGVTDTHKNNVRKCPDKYHKAHLPMKRYRAGLTYKGEHIDLGGFPTEELAAQAYDRKAHEIYGEFALLNFPELATAILPTS